MLRGVIKRKLKVLGVKHKYIHNMITIVLNPEEAQRLDYEHNWKDLISFEDYLSIKAQQTVFESNEKGYQVYSTR